jgi:exodeoxyribonuclease-3
MTTIVTWNINSIKVRLPLVLQWLTEHQPDIVLFQELKCVNDAFPKEDFEDVGYTCVCHGQKTYNGVAILSKESIEDIQVTLPGFEDTQARYIEAFTGKLRVASVYVPNGQEVQSEQYRYKLAFLQALKRHLQHIFILNEAFVIGGDFNVAPYALDVYDPALSGTDRILCSQQEQDALREILYLGFTDALRVMHPNESGLFTWWDYRGGAFEQNKGFRIDHFLLSPQAADHLVSAEVHHSVRGFKRASDHAPVICVLDDHL